MKAAVRALPTRRPPCRLFFGGRTPAVSGVWCSDSPIIALYMCPHAAFFSLCFLAGESQREYGALRAVSMLYMCPHAAVCVSSYCCVSVLILLCVCPRTAIYVSSYCCIYRCGWSCRSRTAPASSRALYMCSKLGTIRSKLGPASGAGGAAAAALDQQLEQHQLQRCSSPAAPTRTLRELRHAAN